MTLLRRHGGLVVAGWMEFAGPDRGAPGLSAAIGGSVPVAPDQYVRPR
jgi:hypothetical protein